MNVDPQRAITRSGHSSNANSKLRLVRKLNPFRPASLALVFALCLGMSLESTRYLQSDNLENTLYGVKQHPQVAAELDAGIGTVQELLASDYPTPGPLAKAVTVTAATADPVETALTSAFRLITFSTLDPIRDSATACLDEGDGQLAAGGTPTPYSIQLNRCNVALLIPVKAWIAQNFRGSDSLAFTLRHELGHAIFLDHDGESNARLQQLLGEKGAIFHSVLIESEADVYALLKTAQRSGSWAAEAILDGLLKFRRIQPRDNQGVSIGTHDTTDALANLDGNRQWLADAVGAADADIVRRTERIAIEGFKAYAARNGVAISDKLNRILGARQASLDSPNLTPSLGKLSVSVEPAPLYAAVFSGDGDELTFIGHHPLLSLLLWSILWLFWLRAGWLSVDFVLREIALSGRRGGSSSADVGSKIEDAALLSSQQPVFSKE